MQKRKVSGLFIILILTAVSVFAVLFCINSNKPYSAFVGIVCTASAYKQESGVGYLTVQYDYLNYGNVKSKRDIVVKVEDINLQNLLAKSEVEDVIGVNLDLTIPIKILKENHMNKDGYYTDALYLLLTDRFDNYLSLADVFFA